ncbi:uncharacterized protein LOC142972959 [Anticarsia gemmatalis]|uniref:uncharacterized protein LOC142972959 n=1 Tax=Anticarsia gemmatalis TaxID=129554 RepID=UPI003F7645FC
MEMAFAKFIMACALCGIATGISINYVHSEDASLKVKRSPGDSFSLFGIGVRPPSFSPPNPIPSAHQSLNSFGNLFTPVLGTRNGNNGNIYKPIGIQNNPTNFLSLRGGATNPPQSYNQNVNENAPTTDVRKPYNPNEDNRGANCANKNSVEYSTRRPATVVSKNPTEASNNAMYVDETGSTVKIDKAVIDGIFKNINDNVIDSTTEDPSTDYTTGTEDYESTTIDELLRIPAPVVASLLG